MSDFIESLINCSHSYYHRYETWHRIYLNNISIDDRARIVDWCRNSINTEDWSDMTVNNTWCFVFRLESDACRFTLTWL